jgi:1,2-diacylglycerol 3-alpha-glucosyltransferase
MAVFFLPQSGIIKSGVGQVNKRVGIFSACYKPTLNGVVVSIETFRTELEKRGWQVYIFAPQTPGYHETEQDSTKVFRYPSLIWPGQKNYPLAIPVLAPEVTQKAKALGLNIIHTQHMFTMGNLGLKLGRDLDIPVVYTYHTLIAEYIHYVPLFSQAARAVIISLSRKYCNKCDQIVTPSSPMKKKLRGYGVNSPIEVIPTGVDISDFNNPFSRSELETKWHLPQGKKILLYVSRIAKEKNLDFLFEAIKILASRREDFHLLMIGGGPELSHYQNLVRQWNLSSFVTFAGMQPKKDTNRFYGACDIFVFPSITETQGIVITEAMAAGIPAVAVNIMGPIDIIDDGQDGFLTPLKSNLFAQRIEKLLDDEKLRYRLGNQARINSQKFSVEACTDKLEEIYEKTISNYRA